jgi:hypothetical protein
MLTLIASEVGFARDVRAVGRDCNAPLTDCVDTSRTGWGISEEGKPTIDRLEWKRGAGCVGADTEDDMRNAGVRAAD